MEEWLTQNWPVLLAGFAAVIVVTGIIKKLIKLAIIAAIVAAVALIIWPMVSEYI